MAEAVGTIAPRFEMRGVRKAFGSTRALDGVDLAVSSGEVCALVGQNGAGKSTLMSVLSGALVPDSGEMRIDGERYQPSSPLAARQAGVAMIYQGLSLAPHLTVMENIALGVEPVRWGLVSRSRMRATAREALGRLGHEDISPDARVGSLSPAQQQLVEIARALASRCRVLVLDEPTSSLTRHDVERLFELVRRLRSQGHAVVYISHFIEEVQAVSDRVVVLRDGRVAGAGLTTEMDGRTIVNLMIGRALDDLYPRSSRAPGSAVLEVSELVPGGATFTLHRGEVLGIAGLLGSGRTELMRSIFGLDAVRAGRVRVANVAGRAGPTRWAEGVGFVSEDRGDEGLAADRSLADNLTLSRLDGLGSGFFVSPTRQDRAARRWIDALDIRCRGPRDAVRALSGGNQQKVAIARLLHHDVDVWLLDEPTRGIDVASKAQIYGLIDRLVSARSEDISGAQTAPAASRAKAVLLVSSYLPELLGLCDRIAVMSRGQLGLPRPVSEWTEHSLMMAVSGVGAEA